MKKVSVEQFKEMKKNGVFVFHSLHCFTCEEHIQTMIREVKDFFLIDTGEDIDYIESLGIRLTPHTRYYKNDKVLWSKQGALYNLQIKELKNIMKGI